MMGGKLRQPVRGPQDLVGGSLKLLRKERYPVFHTPQTRTLIGASIHARDQLCIASNTMLTTSSN